MTPTKLSAALVVLGFSCFAPKAEAAGIAWCDQGKPITFAGVDWESGAFITAVISTILAEGYDCKVDSIPGNTLLLEQANADGEVQIFAEDWLGRSDVLAKNIAEGKTIPVGHPFTGAVEGWFVPTYVIKGDPERGIAPMAPDLKSVTQLDDPAMVELFADPEEMGKGRFLNCPSGWSCEAVSTAKLAAYGLDDKYVNMRPGTGIALDAQITASYMQREPLLFYYWSPTAAMDKFDLTRLEEPPYNEECWKELTDPDGKRDQACAYPAVEVIYSTNKDFHAAAPEVVEILTKAEFPLSEINAALSYMIDNDANGEVAADWFLANKGDIWGNWVSPEARAKIEAAVE